MSQTPNQSEQPAPLLGSVFAAVKDVVVENVTSIAEGIKDVVEDSTHYIITKDRLPENREKTEERLEEIHEKQKLQKSFWQKMLKRSREKS
jgi:cell shape-determining protein MreC